MTTRPASRQRLPIKLIAAMTTPAPAMNSPRVRKAGNYSSAAGLPLMPLTVHLSEWRAARSITPCDLPVAGLHIVPASRRRCRLPQQQPPGAAPWVRGGASRVPQDFIVHSQSTGDLTVASTVRHDSGRLGGLQQVQVDDDINLDPELNAALPKIQRGHIIQSNFDIVDESSFMVSTASQSC